MPDKVTAARGNPINLASVPKENTTITFPFRSATPKRNRKKAMKWFQHAFVFSLTTFVLKVACEDDLSFLALLVIFLLFVGQALSPIASYKLFCFAGFWAITITLSEYRLFLPLTLVAIAGVWYVAREFREHYWSLTMETSWANFRRPKVEPAANYPAFVDAIVSWLTYEDSSVPGIHRSPSGSVKVRLAKTIAVFLLLLYVAPGHALYGYANLFTYTFYQPDSALGILALLLGFCVTFVIAYLSPVVILLLACYFATRSMLGICYATKIADKSTRRFSEVLPRLRRELESSPNEDERNSVFWGNVVSDGSPIFLPMKAVMAHMLMLGSTMSGKTTRMMYLIEGLLLRGDTSIFGIDLKSDTYEILRTMLASLRPTKWFTPQIGDSSYLFSVMDQEFWMKLSDIQRTDIQQASVGLSLSRAYGVSWFNDACFANALHVFRQYPELRSIAKQAERLQYELGNSRSELSPSVRKDGEHLKLILDRLALCDPLNPRPYYSKEALAAGIDMASFYREPSCFYAGLNSMLAPTTSPEIARWLLTSLLAAGMAMPRSERKMNVVIIFDEWQTAISAPDMLERALQQARSVGASLVLSNQTSADFKTPGGTDLTATVYGNTACQSWFSVRDPLGIEQIRELSGKTFDYTFDQSSSVTTNGHSYSVSRHEHISDRLNANHILAASSVSNQFITRIGINAGLAHYDGLPFVASADFHISEQEYVRRLNASWPSASPETIVVGHKPAEEVKKDNVGPSPVISRGRLGSPLRKKRGDQ